MKTKYRKITLGTREWADSNVNCYFGCSNNCRYCYAKKMAIRFNKKTEDTWKVMVPNIKNIKKGYRKRNGRIMFPTSHDITDENLINCLIVLKKLISSGNEILVTTKPKPKCIKTICENFPKNKQLIQFRFTITSKDNNLLKFWEPSASSFEERYESANLMNTIEIFKKNICNGCELRKPRDQNFSPPTKILDQMCDKIGKIIKINSSKA